MKERIDQIRTLLSQLESEASRVEQEGEFRALSGLELPDVICDVVDLLMPGLRPYESVVYIYLLRHSIIQEGRPYVRASIRGLQSAVGQSHRSGTVHQSDNPVESPDYKTVRNAVSRLMQIGALRQEGEPNRDGTLYRILLPEEIDICQRRRTESSRPPVISATEDEADFYNIRENKLKIYERDNYHCTYTRQAAGSRRPALHRDLGD